MSVIYSFLQKRRLHESQHGFIMIFIAYLLSALMLFLGSDIFYNINSTAAGKDEETKEEIQSSYDNSVYNLQTDEYTDGITTDNLINPYGLKDNSSNTSGDEGEVLTSFNGDTIWLFGDSMDGTTFDRIMEQAVESIVISPKKHEDRKTKTINTAAKKVSGKVYDISDKEIKMLQRIVQAEAGGEDMIGKILIVNVIMNRVADKHFPDTVKDVIFQKEDGDYQFSPVGSGRYWDVSISKDTEKAVKRALNGEDYSKGALYFVARDKTDSDSIEWFDDHLKRLFEHGGHEFYKNK